MERAPDFEDDKIRLWRGELPVPASDKDDPTVLRVNVEHEEPYESRVYRLRPEVENFAALVSIAMRPGPGRPPLPLSLATVLSDHFIQDSLVKFLSKRHRESGDISLLIVGTALGRRFLLRPMRSFTLDDYQDKVQRFEGEWVEHGPLVRGPVIGPNDWAAYRNDQP